MITDWHAANNNCVVATWLPSSVCFLVQVEEAQNRLHKWEANKTTEPLLAGVSNDK
jgi:hypothetical protein